MRIRFLHYKLKAASIKAIRWCYWSSMRAIEWFQWFSLTCIFMILKPVEPLLTKRFILLSQLVKMLRPVKTNHNLIRIGGEADGGYLIPDDIKGITGCFSPGVSGVADFEYSIASQGIKCFLADYSVEEPPLKHKLFHFDKKYLGSQNNSEYMNIDSWINKYCSNKSEFILQMDIEGGEYEVINDISVDNLCKFRILVIEFHFLNRLLFRGITSKGFRQIYSSFEKLVKYFEVVHIHPNNNCHAISRYGYTFPQFLEITFLRKDRISTRTPATDFPHHLDRKNVANRADIILPKCWYE